MKLFLDTNIFLEVILEQEKAEDSKSLLSKAEDYDFFISDFSLHSIGLLFFYRKQHDVFQQFLKDIFIDAGMLLISLSVDDMERIVSVSQKFKLDFDDAYQYVVAEKYGLIIVSFDSDFDSTEIEMKIPEEILI